MLIARRLPAESAPATRRLNFRPPIPRHGGAKIITESSSRSTLDELAARGNHSITGSRDSEKKRILETGRDEMGRDVAGSISSALAAFRNVGHFFFNALRALSFKKVRLKRDERG